MKPRKYLRKGSRRDSSRPVCVLDISLILGRRVHETPLSLHSSLSADSSLICLQVRLAFDTAFSSQRLPSWSLCIFTKPPPFPLHFLLLENGIRDISPSLGCSPFPHNARIAGSSHRSTSYSPFRAMCSRNLSAISLPAASVCSIELRVHLPPLFSRHCLLSLPECSQHSVLTPTPNPSLHPWLRECIAPVLLLLYRLAPQLSTPPISHQSQMNSPLCRARVSQIYAPRCFSPAVSCNAGPSPIRVTFGCWTIPPCASGIIATSCSRRSAQLFLCLAVSKHLFLCPLLHFLFITIHSASFSPIFIAIRLLLYCRVPRLTLFCPLVRPAAILRKLHR